jgi:uncharacterized phage protein (TIGR01671 family)
MIIGGFKKNIASYNDRLRFRVWDKRLNRYLGEYDPIQMIMSNGNLAYLDDYGMKFYEVEQCTGLKDRNGTFIYEGDLVKDKDGYIAYVAWFNGAWWLKSEPSQAMDRENEENYAEFEVIGNIHENKELLK